MASPFVQSIFSQALSLGLQYQAHQNLKQEPVPPVVSTLLTIAGAFAPIVLDLSNVPDEPRDSVAPLPTVEAEQSPDPGNCDVRSDILPHAICIVNHTIKFCGVRPKLFDGERMSPYCGTSCAKQSSGHTDSESESTSTIPFL